jgi:hypothetical protein
MAKHVSQFCFSVELMIHSQLKMLYSYIVSNVARGLLSTFSCIGFWKRKLCPGICLDGNLRNSEDRCNLQTLKPNISKI